MRRKDREISDVDEKLRVINKCKVLRLGMAEDNRPYVIPLNFGYIYEDNTLSLYFHSAREGKKIGILKNNPQVCFEMDGEHRLIEQDSACGYAYAYESIIGFGLLEFLEKPEDKIYGLRALMKHQTGRDEEFTFEEGQLKAVQVYRVRASSFTGKRRPFPE
ncbi:MAG: pyridoxamine 5'-phosphate oxidase family protein [Treponema sp.]|nr:pyridoxamine 5'-phosphate oxidase family protein [Treponema sp.]